MIRDDVFRDALALPPADRKKLLRVLLESLDLKMPEEGASPNIVAMWEEEFVMRIINKGRPPAPKPPTRH
jgi:hypothetical protein